MTLRNSFYTVEECRHEAESHVLRFRVLLHAAHPIYQAHFPGQPITPGVCIIQMARELMEQHAGHPLTISQVKNAKFLAIISPVETPSLWFVVSKWKVADAEHIQAQVQVEWGSRVFAKISLDCIPDEY